MIPGMNPRKMQGMMKKMGIAQTEIEATEVIIKQGDKELVIENPQVSKVSMMGQETYQVVGEAVERSVETTPDINEDDINTVAEQTGCTPEQAKEAIEAANGDLAEAIMNLQK